jgi:hypothetical protein
MAGLYIRWVHFAMGQNDTVGRVQGPFGRFAPATGEPPGHRPFTRLPRVVIGGGLGLCRDPGDDLVHAGETFGEG